MPDAPFIINDRRKFTAEGEIRPDAAPREPRPVRDDAALESSASHAVEAGTESHNSGPQLVEPTPAPNAPTRDTVEAGEEDAPPPLTPEQTWQIQAAYTATTDRLDTAVRAMDPGAPHAPAMSFERVVQSLYMQTLMQLGASAEPTQQPRVDILGARQTIDMLTILRDKTTGNLTEAEAKLIEAALFELQMGFLEVTQALAQQAAQRQGQPGAPTMPPPPGGGPSLIR